MNNADERAKVGDDAPAAYYAEPGAMTDLRVCGHDPFAGLPTDPESLCRVAQGLLVHEEWAPLYGVSLAEKLALMQKLCGAEVDITSGSAVRKICEVSALEDARLWAAVASTYDNCFVASAAGDLFLARRRRSTGTRRAGQGSGEPEPFEAPEGLIGPR